MSWKGSQCRNKKLHEKYNQTNHCWFSNFWYSERKERIVKYSKKSKRKKFFKNYANRVVRKSDIGSKKGDYKRAFDSWEINDW